MVQQIKINSSNYEKEKTKKPWLTVIVFVILLAAVAGIGIMRLLRQSRITPLANLVESWFSQPSEEASEEDFYVESTNFEIINPDFRLDRANNLSDSLIEISNFEEGENWEGSGIYDYEYSYEGETSLNMMSADHQLAETILGIRKDFSQTDYFEIMIRVEDIGGLESLNIDFGNDSMESYFRYPINNLHTGWNLVRMPRREFITADQAENLSEWNKIQKIRIIAFSRPGSVFLANFDALKAINNNDFLRLWRAAGEKKDFVSLHDPGDGFAPGLMFRGGDNAVAVLEPLRYEEDFVCTLSLGLNGDGWAGIFLRGNQQNGQGYYLLLNREGKWQTQRKDRRGFLPENEIKKGAIPEEVGLFTGEVILGAEAKDDKISYYISSDGKDFYRVEEIVDDTFAKGGVGVAVLGGLKDGNWVTFDDFNFKRF